ncbi:MAG: glycosyltransferase family 9 protein [Verrucomicrobia bacterium]|nr:glycosyltransferase family 9 protein [Verrucomicrobiota bacterium]
MSALAEYPAFSAPPRARPRAANRPALLVAELRGMGDLAILMPFLQAASQRYDVTLLAVPNAAGLLRRFAPEVELIPCVAPWALFSGGWDLPRWPWRRLLGLVRALRARRFATAVSVWPLASDHLFLRLIRPGRLIGFGQKNATWLLNRDLRREEHTHRPEAWRRLAAELGLPALATAQPRLRPAVARRIVLHSGASQKLRVWPLARYAAVLKSLRAAGWSPVVLCDRWQLPLWHDLGEMAVRVAPDMDELVETIASGTAFLGNDSGPGHLAALCGVPTFTIFGPQLPELFAPGHPQAGWVEGGPCDYKPCYDRCRYAEPHCLTSVQADPVWLKLSAWLETLAVPHAG